MTKRNKFILGFFFACLMICTPFISKFEVDAGDITYEEFIVSETAKSYAHPELFIGSKAIFNTGAEWTSYQFINVVDGKMLKDSVFPNATDFVDEDGNGIVVEIEDYCFVDTALYFKIKAADGYTLPWIHG